MSLLPKTYSYICDCCTRVFNSDVKHQTFRQETLCAECKKELDKEKFGELLKQLDMQIELDDKEFEWFLPKQNNKTVKFELRGDDLQMIKKIKQYSSIENQDIYSWLCYLENEIKEQIK